MDVKTFAQLCQIYDATELDKVRFIAYYLHAQNDTSEFAIASIVSILDELHLPKPNTSRLKQKIRSSSSFVLGAGVDKYKLHGKEILYLEKEFPQLGTKNEIIVSEDKILPTVLTSGTRGFLESLSRQLNAAYQFNIFDGCAVLMRRLLEILLILSYENNGIGNEIKKADGSYVNLNKIISNAKQSSDIALTRESKKTIDVFRQLGNFSAHRIYYNARRNDIDQIKLDYRATIEELLYKSNLRT